LQPNAALINPAWQANRSHTYPHHLSAQYRNQWAPILGSGAYRSFAAAADANWKHGRNNYWGGGIQFCQDQAGKADFNQTQASISGLYSKLMLHQGGKKGLFHYLTLGAGVGIRQYRVDESKLHWVEQFGQTGLFNPNVPAPLILDPYRKVIEETTVGLLWHANNAQNEGFEGGLSIFHLTKPNLSWVAGGNMPLNRRFTVHGSAYHEIRGGALRLKYHFAWLKQGAAQQIVVGSQIGMPLQKQTAVLNTGLAFRKSQGVIGDALIATLNLDFQAYTIAINYDWNLSSLNVVNPFNNAIECAVVYKIKK
jgi:type IX secretion system PorP/SprF family membrane protein